MSNPNSKKKIAEFIKQKREALGWSQGELCRQVYGDTLRKGEISRLEAGKISISPETLDKYLAALNADIDFKEY